MKARILIVDDEKTQREMLARFLKKRGHDVRLASSGNEALDIIDSVTIDIVISDQKMPGMSGLELAAAVRKEYPTVSVVIVTAFGSIENAVQAMKEEVEDYVTKPVDLESLEKLIAKIMEKRHRIHENEVILDKIAAPLDFPGIVYVSDEMSEVMSRAARASQSRATVLITGESGTGKELVAHAVHACGERNDKPFVAVNCSAVPESLIESELFGHEKGAFTGADKKRIGRFEQADGGTLFLDEIGDIPQSLQVKLLRVLQEKRFERVGGSDTIRVDVRIIAATNRDLEEAVREGSFRDDLFFRLNVVHIEMPPLRHRRSDIPALVEHFLIHYAEEHGKKKSTISSEAFDMLVKYSFPGNVRELGNIIEQAVVLSRGDTISVLDLPMRISVERGDSVESDMSLEDRVAFVEKDMLEKALKSTNGNKSAAARILGISEHKVRYLLKKHDMER